MHLVSLRSVTLLIYFKLGLKTHTPVSVPKEVLQEGYKRSGVCGGPRGPGIYRCNPRSPLGPLQITATASTKQTFRGRPLHSKASQPRMFPTRTSASPYCSPSIAAAVLFRSWVTHASPRHASATTPESRCRHPAKYDSPLAALNVLPGRSLTQSRRLWCKPAGPTSKTLSLTTPRASLSSVLHYPASLH